MHLLLLSAGSLLGQNILDCLEGRRSGVRVTGINSQSANARIFRCDRVHLSPRSDEPDFESFLIDKIEAEQPDLILPGRDEDVLHLAELSLRYPSLRVRIPGGSVEGARIMYDKGLSYQFACKYSLPFVPSLIPEATAPNREIQAWASTRYPIMAKPAQGFGSNGIRIITDETQLSALLEISRVGLVLQELVDFGEERLQRLLSLREELAAGIPLFFQVPDTRQFAGQAIILPDGSIGGLFTSRSLMVMGRCEASEPWADPALEQVTRQYAEAIAAIGWRGMFNLQCRQDPEGQYLAHEMNGRMSGSSSARRWLGFDEIRQLVQAFAGIDIGPGEEAPFDRVDSVQRSLTDYLVPADGLSALVQHGVWSNGCSQKTPSPP
jgi:carbamoyl-phosphate synthase large subunit